MIKLRCHATAGKTANRSSKSKFDSGPCEKDTLDEIESLIADTNYTILKQPL